MSLFGGLFGGNKELRSRIHTNDGIGYSSGIKDKGILQNKKRKPWECCILKAFDCSDNSIRSNGDIISQL